MKECDTSRSEKRRRGDRFRIGGLITAALLSDLGWKVCVLEQHSTAGGYTHSYDRNGYEWDVGVHYIGDVGAKTRTRMMFDYLSGDKLKWAPMDDEYDRFYVGDKTFCAKAGKQQFRDNLVRQFPSEEQAIDRYLDLLGQVGNGLTAPGGVFLGPQPGTAPPQPPLYIQPK